MSDPISCGYASTPSGSHCTAQRRDGTFCDEPSANGMPFPICSHHAIKVFMELRDRLADAKDDPIVYLSRMFDAIDDERNRKAKHEPSDGLVYYVAIGEHIKIGYSRNVAQRMRQYPPHRKLLAVEPGGTAMEQRRLREFAEYLDSGKEWFTMGPRLIQHVKGLREVAA